MIKGIALFSGGLDSILAIRLIQQQNVNIEAINFATPFLSHDYKTVKEASETLGLPFHVFELSDTYLDMLKKPVYGYGKHMNPCVDCRIFMLKKASEYMKENGASFLVTGEVLGQRPMSQRPYSLKIIERDTGLEGIIVRPLSARLLSPSIPEKNGWIKREELLAIKGRSRIEQMELAGKFQIKKFLSPSGGCLLCDPEFSKKLDDLVTYSKDFNINDSYLLRLGRHFRLSPQCKLILGRNEEENNKISSLSREKDMIFKIEKFPGPTALLRGNPTQREISLAAKITISYSKGREFKDSEKYVIYKLLHDQKNYSILISEVLEKKEFEDLVI